VPRLKDKSGFAAFDAPSRSDVGLSPRHGDRVLLESCDHLPLFHASSGRSPVAPHTRSVGRSGVGPDRLSIGQIDSTSHSEGVAEKPKVIVPPQVSVWAKGSRADFPGISDLHPKPRHSTPPRRKPRGKCETFTDSARLTFSRWISTVDRLAPAFTMCLSCPGVWDASQNAAAKRVFLLLLKQMTASRDKRIRKMGLLWKQEIQTREAVHFHFLLWLSDISDRAFVHEWIVTRWHALICRGCDEKGRADHLWQHMKPENFQEVRNMAGYFAKYLDKDAKAVLVGEPIPGRWWGKINSDSIPFAEKSVLVDPPARFRVICHRIVRKLRQKKANAAKHAAIQRKMGLVHPSGPNKGKPFYSEFDLACGPRRHILRPEIEHFTGLSLGPYRFPGPVKTSAVILTGEHAPATAKRILAYAGQAFRDYLEANPF